MVPRAVVKDLDRGSRLLNYVPRRIKMGVESHMKSQAGDFPSLTHSIRGPVIGRLGFVACWLREVGTILVIIV